MILDDLTTYLAGAGIGLTSGTNLYAGFVPGVAPDTRVCVYETGGAPPIHTMGVGPNNAIVERPRVQVLAESKNYQTARMLAHVVFRALDGLNDQTLSSTKYHLISAVASPASLGTDTSGRHRIVANYDIIKAVTTSTST